MAKAANHLLIKSEEELFNNLKNEFLNYDPAEFTKNKLRLDKQPFNVLDDGWRFMAEIYRYIALQATTDVGKPVVICKGRQIGATVMAGALDIYFTNSGLFSNPPIRVAHLFPQAALVKRFTQDKLESLIRDADSDFINKNKLDSKTAVDNLTFKQFKTGSLWVESTGKDGDRIRGMTLDVMFFDECFPYEQCIEVEGGKKEKIGDLYNLFKSGGTLPKVKSYNEQRGIFEYKNILNAWERKEKDIICVKVGDLNIKCTNNHPFLTTDGWRKAEDLAGSNILMAPNNDIGLALIATVNEVNYCDYKEKVYDIEVEDNHNFIITSPNDDLNLGGPIVHNCQDMVGTAVGNATKTLTAAKYGPPGKGVQVYFGTPKERGTFFHTIWEMSDKRYYHLGCENCKEYFPFYQTNNNEWKEIWLFGHIVRCPLCGHKQQKIEAVNRGKWIPSRNPDECKYVGFHINQLYHPGLSREFINDLMPENNPSQSERAWNNEVIGEFYSGIGMPLTKTEIVEKCMDPDRAFAKRISPEQKDTYLGMDWGEKVETDGVERGQSFSCAVVLSALSDGTLYIEHAHKLRENSPRYKRDTISELYRRFGIKQGVTDFFYGQDIVREMQLVYNDRLLGAQGSGNLINPLRYRNDELIITYNKDLLIDELFTLIRKGKVRFPWKSYEYIEWLIDHCVSMETSVKMVNGQSIKTYKKGTIPNDGLMALMYAYIAYKFDITKGFSVKPGSKQEPALPKPVLAYAPRLR